MKTNRREQQHRRLFLKATATMAIPYFVPASVLGKEPAKSTDQGVVKDAFIARTMIDGPGGVRKTKGLIRRAFQAQLAGLGFSVVEVLSPCPTYMRMEPVDAMKHVKETVSEYFPLETFRDRTVE